MTPDPNTTTIESPAFTREQRQAIDLLMRGGARYGTRIAVMNQFKDMGLCYAHDKGPRKRGRWTWRPTPKLLAMHQAEGRGK